MATITPSDAAQAASKLLQDKVKLIESLASAIAAEAPIKSVAAALKNASDGVPAGYGLEDLEKAQADTLRALDGVRRLVADRKRDALAGGWTQADLAELGLVKTRAKRASTTSEKRGKSPEAESGAGDAAPSDAAGSPAAGTTAG